MSVQAVVRGLLARRRHATVEQLREKLNRFRTLVEQNDQVLELMAEAGEKLGGEYVFDSKYLRDLADALRSSVHGVVAELDSISQGRYPELVEVLASIDDAVEAARECRLIAPEAPYVVSLEGIGLESVEVVGSKMARLGEIRSRVGCRTPEGFVVTTHACRTFLRAAGVLRDVEGLQAAVAEGGPAIDERASSIRERVLRADLPHEVRRAVYQGVERLVKPGEEDVLLAVRSSGPEEDGVLSFAGQFDTVLGVSAEEVTEAYRRVVASLFAPSVLRYQAHARVPVGCGFMAVGIMRMVPARASGVAYSVDPASPAREVLLVSAARGLGKLVVEGGADVDRIEISRAPGHDIVRRRNAMKEEMFVAEPGVGPVARPVPEEERLEPAIAPWELAELATTVCRIERYMKSAQDVEWAVDAAGQIFILQARPLRVEPLEPPAESDLRRSVERYPVLMGGEGEVACRGIGSGAVHLVDPDDEPGDIPRGAVLVARAATPRIGGLLAGASAVITDLGSATGHFAAVARDLRVPAVVATHDATRKLEEGTLVTVDAEDNVVYAGRVEELLRYQLLKESAFEDTREYRVLRRMLRRIAPLTLRDPTSPDFTARACATYHDVIRFAHEKAVAELTDIGWVKPARGARYVRRLELPIPLDLILIDLGGGFDATADGPSARTGEVTSRPLLPLLQELVSVGVWETDPASMDLDGFMSSATRSMAFTGVLAARPEQNLALVSGTYLHLSLRLGYHFNIVDTHLGDTPADNYIYFRFAGGVTELTRRSRRAVLLKRILERNGFVVEGRGDLVVGRIKGIDGEAMEERLRMVGRLIGFTRQLDIHLRDDASVDTYVQRFLEGGGDASGDAPGGGAPSPDDKEGGT